VRYLNFDLWVDLDSDGLRIEASWPETGEGTPPLRSTPPSFDGRTQPSAKTPDRTREVRISDRAAPKGTQKIGSELFQAIFPREVYGLWCKALDRAEEENAGVRLRLHLGVELWDWPWEWLFDDLKGFLVNVTSPPVSIVRFIDEAPMFRRLPEVVRIRILVVAAQPRGQQRLDEEEEWCELRRGVARLRRWGRVCVEKLSCPTLAQLEDKLSSGRFHVVHFIGHGEFNASGEGGVFFEDTNGGSDRVGGVRLGGVLRAHSSVRLVVLNACKGALDGTIPFAGVAQSLIRQQIPAVVAMQEPIRDQDAVRFSRHFYAGLARGGCVDRALSRARIGLQADNPGSEWSTPVLYLQVSDGRIFPFPWKRIAAFVLSIFLVAFASPLLIDPELQLYKGPPAPSLPSTASTQGCPPSELLGMPFVRIPAGAFTMGSKPWDRDELEHEVTISKVFCMSVYEVTRGQYRKIMGAVPGRAGLSDDLPVTGVSWKDVQKFLAKLNKKEQGAGYRRASEAEWEYAARGGSTTVFSFGDDPDDLYQHGNCKSGKVSDGHDGLAPVGSFEPNNYGLYDMHGNASEWVEDWYGPYPAEQKTDPPGPSTGEEKVRRGGSYDIKPENCSAVFRNHSKPGYRGRDVGFRLVLPVRPCAALKRQDQKDTKDDAGVPGPFCP
jgi:formylglycine-generating enzyme required for sulfatase activity